MSSSAAHGGQKTVYADLLKPDRVANGFHAERLPDSANDEVGVQSTSGASVDVFLEMPDFTDEGELGYNLHNRDFPRVPSVSLSFIVCFNFYLVHLTG